MSAPVICLGQLPEEVDDLLRLATIVNTDATVALVIGMIAMR